MGNALNIDLEGKFVILEPSIFRGKTDSERLFYCESGNGCNPDHISDKIFGEFIFNGKRASTGGYWIARLATKDEVQNALEIKQMFMI